MTKKEMQNRRAEIMRELNQRCETIKAEKRNFTAEEHEEIRSLEAEKSTLEVALRNFENRQVIAVTDAMTEAAEGIRSLISGNVKHVDINLRAVTDASTTTTMAGANTDKVVGVIDPLEKGLILGEIGAQIRTDIPMGGAWAQVAPAAATFHNEATVMSNSKLQVTKKSTVPHRLGIQVFISNQALAMSDIDLMNRVVLPEINRAIERELNAWMFSTTAYNANHNASGVFVNAVSKLTFKGAVPTAAELAKLRGTVKANGGFDNGSYRYVMSALMAAELSVTPVSANSSRMIIEDGKIAGIPVYETEYIELGNETVASKGAKYIGFGRFSDAVVAQLSQGRLTIDANSKEAASADGVYVIYNVDYDMTSLYDGKTFGLGTATIS